MKKGEDMMEKKNRNKYIDYLRGIAILFVVLGHTMTGSSQIADKNLLYNCIWSVQMPLFFIISGYVTRYSAPILCIDDFLKYLKKRTLAYLLPWFSWTIIVRGFIFKQKSFLNLSYLLWNMDAGYWFLFTLWLISLIYGIASLLSNKKSKNSKICRLIICCFIGICILALIGKEDLLLLLLGFRIHQPDIGIQAAILRRQDVDIKRILRLVIYHVDVGPDLLGNLVNVNTEL